MAIDRADWNLRSPEFGAVREYDDGRPVVAMEYDAAAELRAAWLELEPHPHILDALAADGDKLLVRYAALYWKHPPIRVQLNRRAREMVAEWGVQLVNAYSTIVTTTQEVAHFLRPNVKIDLAGAARIGFLPVTREDVPTWPRCEEPAIVYAIGRALQALCTGLDSDDAERLRKILDRCSKPDPEARYQSLEELAATLRAAGGNAAVRAGESLASWTMAEEGLGWLAVRQPTRSFALFEGALEIDPHLRTAEQGLSRAFEQIGIVHGSLTAKAGPSKAYPTEGKIEVYRWSDAMDAGFRFETQRLFKEALGIYWRIPKGVDDVALFIAIARCHLALGEASHAIDYAQRTLAVSSNSLDAHSIRARAYLLAHRYDDALKCAGFWVTADSNDANAHYTRGRALLALKRFVEARDAFDRACALKPAMLEAMLLRREADRAASHVRDAVGTQPPFELDLPEHLAHLREPLLRGRIDEAIALLADAKYDDDAPAKLVHARCLAFEKRFDEALALYDFVSRQDPRRRDARLGKADALLALDRPEEALTLFDQIETETPDDPAALEGRAFALRQLGREADAEQAIAKLLARSGTRSELRIRTLS